MAKLLLIDDDLDLTQLVSELLTIEGFHITVANDGEAGLAAIDDSFDLILLDVMMPKLNGLSVLKSLRQHSHIPVLMLSAKGQEIDRVLGLELGADDYLPKPFGERELLARINAILRRAKITSANSSDQNASEELCSNGIRLIPKKQQVFFQETELELTSVEFLLLQEFLKQPGEVLSKANLSEAVLGKKLSSYDRAVDVHVSNLRKKLSSQDEHQPFIKTLRGRGYLWVSED